MNAPLRAAPLFDAAPVKATQKFDLPAMVASTGRKQDVILRPQELPNVIVNELIKIVNRVPQEWARQVKETILPAYHVGVQQLATDAANDPLDMALDFSSGETARTAAAVQGDVRKWLERTDRWHVNSWGAAVKSGTGIDVFPYIDRQANSARISAMQSRIASLIKDLDAGMRKDVEETVWKGFLDQTPRDDMAKLLMERIGVGRSRAELIASDQANKTAAELTAIRQAEANIQQFVWTTAKDDRVRPEHAALHGKIFRWDNPPSIGLPGTPIRCRCTGRAYIPLETETTLRATALRIAAAVGKRTATKAAVSVGVGLAVRQAIRSETRRAARAAAAAAAEAEAAATAAGGAGIIGEMARRAAVTALEPPTLPGLPGGPLSVNVPTATREAEFVARQQDIELEPLHFEAGVEVFNEDLAAAQAALAQAQRDLDEIERIEVVACAIPFSSDGLTIDAEPTDNCKKARDDLKKAQARVRQAEQAVEGARTPQPFNPLDEDAVERLQQQWHDELFRVRGPPLRAWDNYFYQNDARGQINNYRVNAALRRGGRVAAATLRQLDQLIEAHTLPDDVMLYRAVGDMTAPFKVGDSFRDLGYFHTSGMSELSDYLPTQWEGSVLFMVRARRGMHAMPGYPDLVEFVLPRGQAWRVVENGPESDIPQFFLPDKNDKFRPVRVVTLEALEAPTGPLGTQAEQEAEWARRWAAEAEAMAAPLPAPSATAVAREVTEIPSEAAAIYEAEQRLARIRAQLAAEAVEAATEAEFTALVVEPVTTLPYIDPDGPAASSFWNWFGESRAVVTVSGNENPLVVWRGANKGPLEGDYTYFAYDRELAEAYSDIGDVRPYYLSLQNPLIIRTPREFELAWLNSGAEAVDGPFYPNKQHAFNNWVKARGFDGIMITPEAFEGEEGHRLVASVVGEPQIVTFRRDQIRPAASEVPPTPPPLAVVSTPAPLPGTPFEPVTARGPGIRFTQFDPNQPGAFAEAMQQEAARVLAATTEEPSPVAAPTIPTQTIFAGTRADFLAAGRNPLAEDTDDFLDEILANPASRERLLQVILKGDEETIKGLEKGKYEFGDLMRFIEADDPKGHADDLQEAYNRWLRTGELYGGFSNRTAASVAARPEPLAVRASPFPVGKFNQEQANVSHLVAAVENNIDPEGHRESYNPRQQLAAGRLRGTQPDLPPDAPDFEVFTNVLDEELPVIVRYDGYDYILQGHERLARAAEQGHWLPVYRFEAPVVEPLSIAATPGAATAEALATRTRADLIAAGERAPPLPGSTHREEFIREATESDTGREALAQMLGTDFDDLIMAGEFDYENIANTLSGQDLIEFRAAYDRWVLTGEIFGDDNLTATAAPVLTPEEALALINRQTEARRMALQLAQAPIHPQVEQFLARLGQTEEQFQQQYQFSPRWLTVPRAERERLLGPKVEEAIARAMAAPPARVILPVLPATSTTAEQFVTETGGTQSFEARYHGYGSEWLRRELYQYSVLTPQELQTLRRMQEDYREWRTTRRLPGAPGTISPSVQQMTFTTTATRVMPAVQRAAAGGDDFLQAVRADPDAKRIVEYLLGEPLRGGRTWREHMDNLFSNNFDVERSELKRMLEEWKQTGRLPSPQAATEQQIKTGLAEVDPDPASMRDLGKEFNKITALVNQHGGAKVADVFNSDHNLSNQLARTWTAQAFKGAVDSSTITSVSSRLNLQRNGHFSLNATIHIKVPDPATGVERAGTISMSRTVKPELKTVYHDFLSMDRWMQSGGITKATFRNLNALYDEMGIETIPVHAALEVGGYSWLKYGFVPDSHEWRQLRDILTRRLNRIDTSGVPPETMRRLAQALQSDDPKMAWAVSDLTDPVIDQNGQRQPLGKALLLGTSWSGRLNRTDPEQMQRFLNYIGKNR